MLLEQKQVIVKGGKNAYSGQRQKNSHSHPRTGLRGGNAVPHTEKSQNANAEQQGGGEHGMVRRNDGGGKGKSHGIRRQNVCCRCSDENFPWP